MARKVKARCIQMRGLVQVNLGEAELESCMIWTLLTVNVENAC